ncbi:MAG: prolipoprotein diacylglyceryl transferase [Candidatus Omnitrophica bacterium]|nr:prolipoprotein diacylglyceryl transferase [Candidatus Omnitrophota bacterium]
MHPILLKLGPLNIYSYGVMVAVGFSTVAFLVYRRASKFGVNRDMVIDYLILVLVSGVIGARILYVFLNFGYYKADPIEILNLSKGGLVWYGGFIAAILASVWFANKRRVDLWSIADLLAPYIALGQAFGRIGCYLNGCCYGIPAPENFIFGRTHPTQIYSSILLVIIFVVLLKWQNARRFRGEIFMGYCILYSCKRFLIEFMRGDNPRIFLGLTVSQLVSAAVLIAALCIFKIKADEWKRKVSAGSK